MLSLVAAARDPEWSVTLGGIATPHICHSRPPSLKTHKYTNAKIHKSKNTQIQSHWVASQNLTSATLDHITFFSLFRFRTQIKIWTVTPWGWTHLLYLSPHSLFLIFSHRYQQSLDQASLLHCAPLPLPTLMIFKNITSLNTARRIYLHTQPVGIKPNIIILPQTRESTHSSILTKPYLSLSIFSSWLTVC